ncbi:Endoglucanase precursor [Solibacillus isronensis B3W22]|uniref:Endoglucanase n=1 Tax=Solibacillus isronensis B3W22 TaxID=1224748 RepID=K1L9H5_9BACL|nr:S-layer homology domain-containing protein [Solibacillus isronensis]AMO84479.1 endoglucanase [Solibacillus silvestris]EKB47088.1 Endoglucanase precursor [Solibacillus isronensis B3W22]
MANKSKATKAVLASLLATSAIVPAMAVSADTTTETKATDAATSTASKTIDFKVDADEALKGFIPTTGKLVERNGQQFINIELSDAVLAMVNSVTVAGQPAMAEYNGKKHINIPVTADYAPVEATLNMTIPFVGKDPVDYKVTLTPDAKSIKEVTETTKPVEEVKEEKVYTPGKTFDSVADGTYDIVWDAYNSEKVGNYKAITNHFTPKAKLIVKDGKYSVEVSVAATSKEMVAGFKIAGKEATEKDGVYTVEIPSISELHEAGVHVVVPAAKMDKWYDFGFAIETADLELPKAEVKPAPVESVKMDVTALKNGSQELSIMHNKYLDDEVTVTTTEGGYDVELTFPEGQHLLGFDVEGATVALKSEEKVGNNTVKIYTLSVKDLEKIYTATADLKVVLNGNVLYETAHDFQMKFSDKNSTTVPFKDIANNGNKDAIINLYNKGIFKAADKFNPGNNLKRSQFALMLNRALKLDVPAKANFSDIAKYDAETKTAINALNGYGIINGKTATTFAPGQDITRKQAALMIYRLLEKNGYKASGEAAKFSDMPKEVEASKAISELNKLGIISGFEGKFNPENKLTRSQMAKILNNTLTVVDGLKK